MQPLNIIQALLKQESLIDNLALALKPGQIISGKVIKHFPNNNAEVLIGSNKMIARIETPLSVNQRYWFQVQPGEGQVHLKLLDTKGPQNRNDGMIGLGSRSNTKSLLKELSLPVSKDHVSLIKFLLAKQLPITKESLQLSVEWLKDKTLTEGLKVIELAMSRQLPLTKNVLNALYTITEDEAFSEMLSKLQTLLKNQPESHTANRIINLIDGLKLFKSVDDSVAVQNKILEDSSITKHVIRNLISTIGFSYENEAIQLLNGWQSGDEKNSNALKPLLMRLLSEEPSSPIEEASERLLNKITGFQVLSQESGPLQQLIFQIPLSFWNRNTDVTMQWSGKRTKDGKIDPDYCRILFYLTLEHLKETIVDLHVQNRVISISIINVREDLKNMTNQYVHELKKNLKKLDYHLTSVQFEKPAVKNHLEEGNNGALPNLKPPIYYNGVDFRI
ncbi:hypothetical protein F7731_07760 [Cytobacillus depressus]|uniref:Flagellar hook-length control protein FliK n=1 Tax=Cytobacillus depressus TaxID=1602942 RepID=A0A6L3V7U6_9BACI|nr:hypothetical protein [Cytobacillus depressus]KAB2337492.1 hypothetical protein F7731_07760 [Cytobacillus depressus]